MDHVILVSGPSELLMAVPSDLANEFIDELEQLGDVQEIEYVDDSDHLKDLLAYAGIIGAQC